MDILTRQIDGASLNVFGHRAMVNDRAGSGK